MALIPLGIIMRMNDKIAGGFFIGLGLIGLFIYFVAKTIKDYLNLKSINLNIIQLILVVLMTVVLFSKYLFLRFSDYIGLLIIPLFIIVSIIYLLKEKSKNINITITSIFYLLLTIPLFAFEFHKSPRQYIPKEWYNRYDVRKGVPIDIPYGFHFKETEELSIKAFELRKTKQYYEAIQLYRQAIKIEPNNPRLFFDLSDCYARVNNLESAISTIDTAIQIDSKYAAFYNNRGLIYYKLKENKKAINDYLKAIEIDSTQMTFYCNIALVYYYEEEFNKACEAIKKAESLGLEVDNYEEFERIKNRCSE